MPPAGRFWPNVTALAVVHVAIVAGLFFLKRDIKRPNLESIMWLNAGSDIPVQISPDARPASASAMSLPNPIRSKPQDEVDSTRSPAKAELPLPTATRSVSAADPTKAKNETRSTTPKVAPKGTKREKPVGNSTASKSVSKKKAISDKQ